MRRLLGCSCPGGPTRLEPVSGRPDHEPLSATRGSRPGCLSFSALKSWKSCLMPNQSSLALPSSSRTGSLLPLHSRDNLTTTRKPYLCFSPGFSGGLFPLGTLNDAGVQLSALGKPRRCPPEQLAGVPDLSAGDHFP